MSSIHLNRKELKRPDAFLAKLAELFLWVKKNVAYLIGAVALAFLGLGIYLIYENYVESKNKKAMAQFFMAEKAFETAMAKPEIKKQADAKDDPEWESKLSSEIEALQKVVNENSGTFASFKASMLLGNLYFSKDQPKKAAEYYRKASKAVNKIDVFALHSLAYALESAGEYDLALDAFKKLLNSSQAVAFRADTLFSLARVYKQKGDLEKTKEYYEMILKEFPNTQQSRKAELLKNS